MNAQVFRGRTLADARRVAIDKLGPETVILTTRTVRKTGLGGLLGASEIEIAATAQEAAPLAHRAPAATASKATANANVLFAKGVYVEPSTGHAQEIAALRAELKGDIRALKSLVTKAEKADDTTDVVAELAQLRELIEGLTASKASPKAKLTAQIQELGFEGAAAAALGRRLSKAAEGSSLVAELSAMLRIAEWPLEGERVLVALVGPSGVGKTTTAAKLAARARMAGRTVTLVTCDTYRVGGVAQLAHYAELMGVECLTPRTADDLTSIMENCGSDVLIVDTSGRPPTAEGTETALAPGRKGARTSRRTRHVLLCMPAAIRANDAARVVRRFAPVSPTALAITKIDETDAPAGILHSTWASKLPVSVVCNGHRVPEDIAPATIEVLTSPFTPKAEERTAVA